ncbi:MAG TPA: F0F1 ATP synthase subunit epsilon [Actinobacteria bacterium]|nr:F0F1 ATP synthase subunit epsilon [Actinomycetota bacterium]
MAQRQLQCEVITPEKIIYEGKVDMVVAPGAAGELGILPLHMPIVTTLRVGELRLKHGEDQQDYIAIDGGYMEVSEDKVTILADAAEYASKMDIAEVNKVKEEIEARLASIPKDSDEFFTATAELERAVNRLSIAQRRAK